ncbi:MAG TPA: MFS transporter [Gemmatimonadaceae bacterium]|nr:MFS transporter [Gemmatimonadaceae bacterium]
MRVLAQRNFAPYFVGNFLSNAGTWFQSIAQSLLVYRLTGSSFMVGVVNFAQFAGVVLLSPWSGPAADRFDRKRLLIITQLGLSVVTAALAWLVFIGRGTVTVVVVQTLVYGFISAFATPAMQAIIPGLVQRDDVGAAVAMNSVSFNLARAIGPVAGALVVAGLGIGWAISVDAVSYLILVAALLLVHPTTSKPPEQERRPRLIDSIRLVSRDRELLVLLVAIAAVSLSMDPVSTLTPQFARQIFHRSDTMSGVLMGAFGAGAVAASLFPYAQDRSLGRLLAPMLALMGVGLAAMALMPGLIAAAGCLAVSGFGYLAGQTRATTLLQLEVDDRQRGRVMALWSVAFLGSRPIASLADGGLAKVVGVRTATLIMAVPVFAAAIMIFVHGLHGPKEVESTSTRK